MHNQKRRKFIKLLATASAGAELSGCVQTQKPVAGVTKSHAQQQIAKILIIGAGLAGLNCARILQNAGLEVKVLEAQPTAGGRTRTELHQGIPLNMGGIEIGDGYSRFLELCSQYQLQLINPAPVSRATSLSIDGRLIDQRDWPSSDLNPLPQSLKSILPSRLQSTLHQEDFPLSTVTDWLKKQYAEYDISEAEFLRTKGATDQVLKLINQTGNFNDVNTVSALHTMRAIAYYRFGRSRKTMRVRGGNQQLAVSMAETLEQVEYSAIVKRIEEQSSGVVVTCSDGATWFADHVVITLPYSVLRNMELRAPIDPMHLTAIEQLPYTKISKLILQVDEPFWERDRLPANLWCDALPERGFLSYTESGQALYTLFINGKAASTLDKLSNAQATELLLKRLTKIRPSTHGCVSPLAYYSWGNDPFAAGAYHAYAPGQIAEFANQMTRSTKRLHFAGEHCARAEPGMEGALESGEIAARQLLQAQKSSS